MSFQGTPIKTENQNTSSPPPPTKPQPLKQTIYPSVQCKNPKCYFWSYDPTPGSKCVKCMEVLPTWVGYLNADKDNGPSIPPLPLERTDYQEMWFYDDDESRMLDRTTTCCIDELNSCSPPQLTDDAGQEHLTNKERVVRSIMIIYGLDREGAMKKIDQLVKTAVVEYF